MPNCFQLCKIGGDGHAIPLQEIDTELWIHFEGAEPEENDKWYCGWYDTIGLDLAMGKAFHQIKENAIKWNRTEKFIAVIDYLAEHYAARSWWEPK